MRNQKLTSLFSALLLALCLAVPASAAALEQYGMLPIYGQDLRDGTYAVAVKSEPFQVAAAELTVSGGAMTAELTVADAGCFGLYLGTAAEAEAGPAGWIEPSAAGTFTLPVSALDRTIACAFYNQDAWEDGGLLFAASSLPEEALLLELPDYDRIEAALAALEEDGTPVLAPVEAAAVDLEDGEYAVALDLTGGSGKASVLSPTLLVVRDGRAYVRLQWSSANYDYMIVGTETYYNESEPERNSVFEIPLGGWDEALTVIADTTAMGTPHEVRYTLTAYRDSVDAKETLPQEAAKRVVLMAAAVIVAGGVLNAVLKRRKSAV